MTLRFICVVAMLGAFLSSQAQAEVMAPMDQENAWSEQDVNNYCLNLYNHKAVSYADCVKRNKHRIGHDKSPGDSQAIEEGSAKTGAAPASNTKNQGQRQ